MSISISVIIPVYNTQQFLKRCIESVLNQDLINIEIIIVDDASTDNSYDTALKIQETDNRIRLKKVEKNRGQAYARNIGLSVAIGEYILFLDSDDHLENNVLKTLYNFSNNENLDILEARYKKITKNKIEIKPANFKLTPIAMSGEDFADFNGDISVVVWDKLWNRSFLEEKQIKFEDRKFEDVDFVIRAFLKAEKVKNIDFVIYNYIIRSNSTMTSGISFEKTKGYVSLMAMLDKLIAETPGAKMKVAMQKILIYTFLSAPDYFEKKMKENEFVEFKRYKKIYKKNRFKILNNVHTNLPLKILVSISPIVANILYKKIKKD